MYVVTEADAAAIREAYETGGELSAAVELRRRFPWHHGQRRGQGAGASDRCLDATATTPSTAP
jgi:hypothetical protein